jgi:hypothetical protein
LPVQKTTFYKVVPGKQFIPLGQISLPVTFRDTSNYRTEMHTFEVVNFSGPYHIILGRPCYIKFIAIPSYAYLKLKIPGHAGIITVEAKAQWALDYKQNSTKLAKATITTAELNELCLSAPPSLANPSMSSMSGAFKASKDAKAVEINGKNPTKTVQIGARLSPK